ncbi:hypothetical protein MIDIC_590032 [Alphaproteobacteria bacterium]
MERARATREAFREGGLLSTVKKIVAYVSEMFFDFKKNV